MKPYWVDTGNPLRLAIVPRPRGGDWLEDELDQMKRAGVDVLVSMLQVDEAVELGLSSEAESFVKPEGSSSDPSRSRIEKRRRPQHHSPGS